MDAWWGAREPYEGIVPTIFPPSNFGKSSISM